jgi:hypothetical protein
MNAGILRRIRECVRKGRVLVSNHTEEELEADGLTAFDLDLLLGSGFLAERQRDRVTGEWKYLLEGVVLGGGHAAAVVRMDPADMLIVVTVYRLGPPRLLP